MTLPTHVQVGPIRYSLAVDQAAIDHTGSGKAGNTNHPLQTILLSSEQGPDQEADTVLHEVLHACLHQSDGELSVEQEERLVLSLAPLLLDTLRRNPELVAYLMGAKEEP